MRENIYLSGEVVEAQKYQSNELLVKQEQLKQLKVYVIRS